MPVRKYHFGNMNFIVPNKKDEVILNEVIGAIRWNSNNLIGSFEDKFETYDEASKVLEILIDEGAIHMGTVRRHYSDGSVSFLGAKVIKADNNSVGVLIAGDMFGYLIGDKEIGIFEPKRHFFSHKNLYSKIEDELKSVREKLESRRRFQ